jgi:hypothetical protein
MTNIRKLLYLIAILLVALDMAFLKFLGLWAIMVVCADPGFHPNRWNVVLAIVTVISLALARFGVFANGSKVAVLSAIACLVVALVNRLHHRQHSLQQG